MKKFALFAFGVIALVGMINCTIIEPAFAYKDECTTTSCQDENHPCFICHSCHHQWVGSQNLISFSGLLPATIVSHETAETVLNPPTGLIFHPPIAL